MKSLKLKLIFWCLQEILSYCFPQNLYDAKDILNNQRKLNEQGNILKSTSDQSGSCNKTFSWLNLSHLTSVRFFLLCILWTVLWLLFINLEFGAVYFVLSLLFIMYKSTSTRTDRYAPSAYSVFNPNCERLDGTFTSEQFEKELRYGANSVS